MTQQVLSLTGTKRNGLTEKLTQRRSIPAGSRPGTTVAKSCMKSTDYKHSSSIKGFWHFSMV